MGENGDFTVRTRYLEELRIFDERGGQRVSRGSDEPRRQEDPGTSGERRKRALERRYSEHRLEGEPGPSGEGQMRAPERTRYSETYRYGEPEFYDEPMRNGEHRRYREPKSHYEPTWEVESRHYREPESYDEPTRDGEPRRFREAGTSEPGRYERRGGFEKPGSAGERKIDEPRRPVKLQRCRSLEVSRKLCSIPV
jgi:hypothetical protein